ncbi:hypothetical protein [Salinispora arenicola]|uniref:hypothetical protein n=1 Tax=Salinispora arenicola TaxID=168697 RepID=UPI0003A242F7|nr:hypothetical protein [Salinispora arenicola]
MAHLATRSAPSPSSLVRVRRQRSHDRPPVLLPGEILAVLDGCAVYDVTAGRRVGNLRDRLLFAVQIDWTVAEALHGWSYATRWKRLPLSGTRARLRVVFRFPRLALLAACHNGAWWELDDWHARCDPRIPLSARESLANYGCSLITITRPWLPAAAKWHLGTMLESGTLRWTTFSQERLKRLRRFGAWLDTLGDPLLVLSDPGAGCTAGLLYWSVHMVSGWRSRKVRTASMRALTWWVGSAVSTVTRAAPRSVISARL